MDKHGIDRDQLKVISVDEALDNEVNPDHPEYYRSLIRRKNKAK